MFGSSKNTTIEVALLTSVPTIRLTSPKLDSGLLAATCFLTSLEYKMYPVTNFLPSFFA